MSTKGTWCDPGIVSEQTDLHTWYLSDTLIHRDWICSKQSGLRTFLLANLIPERFRSAYVRCLLNQDCPIFSLWGTNKVKIHKHEATEATDFLVVIIKEIKIPLSPEVPEVYIPRAFTNCENNTQPCLCFFFVGSVILSYMLVTATSRSRQDLLVSLVRTSLTIIDYRYLKGAVRISLEWQDSFRVSAELSLRSKSSRRRMLRSKSLVSLGFRTLEFPSALSDPSQDWRPRSGVCRYTVDWDESLWLG